MHPCDRASLEGAIRAAEGHFIWPILVGPEPKIRSVAAAEGIDIAGYEIIDSEHSHAAAAEAVLLARAGKVEALMKGSLHTDELMREVTAAETGLRTARRISHAFVMDVPTYAEPIIITDAAINIFPTLDDKRDICQNAIDLAQILGCPEPRVAVLSAVETVTAKIPSTLEAAALSKMADRGQITGGSSMGRWRSTMPLAKRPRTRSTLSHRSRAKRTSSSSPIWRLATCWQSSSHLCPVPMPLALSLVRESRSF